MATKRTEPFDERDKDRGAERIDAVGETPVTLEPGESVTMVSPGETEVITVPGRNRGAETAPVRENIAPTTNVAATPVGRDWLSMSTDNTPEGAASGSGNTGPIDLVSPGMRVVDAKGDDLGKVDTIKMGDPGAVTTRGESYNDSDLFEEIGRAVFGGSPLPEQIQENLLRTGYISVDGKGWVFETDYFVAANQIARVEGDTVYLSVLRDALPTT